VTSSWSFILEHLIFSRKTLIEDITWKT